MKFLSLVFANLRRNRTRSALTILSVVVAFLLFGLLKPVGDVFEKGTELGVANRLIVAPKHSISEMLPLSYANRVRQVPGVVLVTYQCWFGGVYQDTTNFFQQWAVSKEYLTIHEEMEIDPAQRHAFETTRTGAIAGRNLAETHGWRIGDKIPLKPTIWHNADGTHWEFDLVGIYDGDDRVNKDMMLLNFDYLDEHRAFANGTINNVIFTIDDSSRTNAIAAAVDKLFENSQSETVTSTEREYYLEFARQIGDIALIVDAILVAVFFTILLLTANTMSQAIRERIPELAVLKTLGFRDNQVLWLVLAESVSMMVLGAIGGLVLSFLLLAVIDTMLPALVQVGGIPASPRIVFYGIGIGVMAGIAVGLPPALQARSISIVNALRRS